MRSIASSTAGSLGTSSPSESLWARHFSAAASLVEHELLQLGGLEEQARVLGGVGGRSSEQQQRLDQLGGVVLGAEEARHLVLRERVARLDQRRLAVSLDGVVGVLEALLVEDGDLEPEGEAPGVVALAADEREQRAPRLVVAAGLLEQAVARAQGLRVVGGDRQGALDQREGAIAIADAIGHDLGGAEEELALERRIRGQVGLGLEGARELLRVPGALGIALEGEDRRAPLGREGEDLLDLLDGAGGLHELVFPDRGELLVEADAPLGIGLDLRGLRVELDSSADAAGVGVGIARGRRAAPRARRRRCCCRDRWPTRRGGGRWPRRGGGAGAR